MTKLIIPPRLMNLSLSPTVSTLSPRTAARIGASRSASERQTKIMWHLRNSCMLSTWQTITVRSLMRWSCTCSSSSPPNGSDPTMPMISGESGSVNLWGGQSTNFAKLKRNAALVWYSSPAWLSPSSSGDANAHASGADQRANRDRKEHARADDTAAHESWDSGKRWKGEGKRNASGHPAAPGPARADGPGDLLLPWEEATMPGDQRNCGWKRRSCMRLRKFKRKS